MVFKNEGRTMSKTNHSEKTDLDLTEIYMELQTNLLCAFDTFTLVKYYGSWWGSLQKDEPSDHMVDKSIAIKLKEYLLIQITAIFYDRSSKYVASLHTLKVHLPDSKKYLVERFANKHKELVKRVGCLRSKLFAHNEILNEDLIKDKVNEYMNNVSNDDLEILFKDAFDMLTDLAYADLQLPVPLTDSYIENDVQIWFKEKQMIEVCTKKCPIINTIKTQSCGGLALGSSV